MTRIERLTPEQEEDLVVFREAERRRALSTASIDHERARASVRALYAAAGQPEPEVLIFTSPMLCLMARGLLRQVPAVRGELADQLGGQLADQLRGQLVDLVIDQLGDLLDAQRADQLWDALIDHLGDQLWNQRRDQLDDKLAGWLRGQLVGPLSSQMNDQLRVQLRDQLKEQIEGQHAWAACFDGAWDAYWLAPYEFYRRIGVRYQPRTAEHLAAYRGFMRECGMSFLFPGVALVSDRPERLSFDAQRRLHAADGPALRYRDGYRMYAWRGQRIPAEYIEQRHTRAAADVLREPNAEMRRILMEVYTHVHGPDAMLAAMDAQLLDEDTAHGRPRRLYDIGGVRYLHVVNGTLEPDGTRRTFLLGAHPQAATPHEAVAASYARPPERFREAVRT